MNDIWIISITTSEGNGSFLCQFEGTEEQVKSFLASKVREDVANDKESFYNGTTNKNSISKNGNYLEGYATYSDYHVDYTAIRLKDIPKEQPYAQKHSPINTEFTYVHRDDNNSKHWYTVVLKGEMTEEQKTQIYDCLWSEYFFMPGLLGLPDNETIQNGINTEYELFETGPSMIVPTNKKPTIDLTVGELTNRFVDTMECWWPDSPHVSK